MSKNNDSGKFWPYMILGFLAIGITLGYWTIKSTISMPVRQENAFMMKYQDADKFANEIAEAQSRFDSKYDLNVSGLEKSDFKPKHLKRKPHQYFKLNNNNSVIYKITKKDGKTINDANVTLLLTRPSTNVDDKLIGNIKSNDKGEYIANFSVNKPGRYILRVRVQIGKDLKFLDTYCYKEK
jgi:hypothetical protein